MPWCVLEESCSRIDWAIVEIDWYETTRDWGIRIIIVIVFSYCNCTTECNVVVSRSMSVEINSIVIIILQWFTIFCFIF